MTRIKLPKKSPEIIQLSSAILTASPQLNTENLVHPQLLDELTIMLEKARPLYNTVQFHKSTFVKLNEDLLLLLGNHQKHRQLSPGSMRFVLSQIKDMLKVHYKSDVTHLKQWGFELE